MSLVAGAVLKILGHANPGRIPRTYALVEISIPNSVSIEIVRLRSLPGWDEEDQGSSRRFGDRR